MYTIIQIYHRIIFKKDKTLFKYDSKEKKKLFQYRYILQYNLDLKLGIDYKLKETFQTF